VAGLIDRELRQTRPATAIEEEAYLNLVRTSNVMWQDVAELLRTHDLTPTQYNALRILRGAGAEGLTCGEMRDRMVTIESDVTRLLDRMERRGMLERWRTEDDRRVVRSRITAKGLGILAALDDPLTTLHRRQFHQLGAEEVGELVSLLEKVRRNCTG
jgi:DNA-binding MarR family transcriptional regulator